MIILEFMVEFVCFRWIWIEQWTITWGG